MALENAVDISIGVFDGVIARQIPEDAHRAEMIGPPQMQDFLDNLRGCAIGRVLRDGLAVLQTSNAMLPVGNSPAIEAGAPNAEITARLPNITERLSMLENPKFVLCLAPELVHCHHPFRPAGLH
jgi:hypothetical protein